MCDNSKIGSLDLVKNSFAAEPGDGKRKDKNGRVSFQWLGSDVSYLLWTSCAAPTGYEAGEVGLNCLELVNVILPLLICDFPGVVVGAGLSLDLIGGRC